MMRIALHQKYLTTPVHIMAMILVTTITVVVSAPPGFAQRGRIAPETATGFGSQKLATAKNYMVSAANPLAAKAGLEMLRAGGSAVDAAIATQLVLGLVEPQSSGLGGGAFIVHFDAKERALTTYDGREKTPASANPERFLTKAGAPLPFKKAVNSGLSIGVPGTVRLLETAHKKHGRLAWTKLFGPALRLANGGFKVSQRLHYLLRWVGAKKFDTKARRYFFDDKGNARPVGSRLKNPAYATTLRAIAKGGADAFYTGKTAEEIVQAGQAARNFKSDMTLQDLASYQVVERTPVCTPYRGFRVCGMGPPSSGGPAIVQILKLLTPFSLGSSAKDAMNPKALHLIAEAEKLAYADRNRYIGDPDFVSIPSGMLNDRYLATRAKLIDPARAMAKPKPGNPPGAKRGQFGKDFSIERSGTSHISVIDGDGNTVSMTTTIEGAFGSGHWAAGFLLNNELTDFSFRPTDKQGRAIANRVQGGKRPRSTMAPVIVFDQKGDVFAAVGSPGGGRIILYVTKALIGLIDWKLDAQEAVSLANFGSMGKAFQIETGFKAVQRAFTMKRFGHAIRPDLMNSGLHVVVRRGDHLEGAADPRREGRALGD